MRETAQNLPGHAELQQEIPSRHRQSALVLLTDAFKGGCKGPTPSPGC